MFLFLFIACCLLVPFLLHLSSFCDVLNAPICFLKQSELFSSCIHFDRVCFSCFGSQCLRRWVRNEDLWPVNEVFVIRIPVKHSSLPVPNTGYQYRHAYTSYVCILKIIWYSIWLQGGDKRTCSIQHELMRQTDIKSLSMMTIPSIFDLNWPCKDHDYHWQFQIKTTKLHSITGLNNWFVQSW